MRLIDADALYDAFERTPWMDNADRDIAEEVAENAPTVAEDNNVPVKQPDPITGLVPCGCGERAMILGLQGFCYECIACGTTTRNFETEAQAKAAWNTAMGWRAEE